jgi:hypothetical protein
MARNGSEGSDRGPASNREVELILRMIDGIHHRGERLESLDEQRVRLYFTLVSGSLALLTIAVQFGKLGVTDLPLASTVLLFILLAYGGETLHSLNWSRISIRENQVVEGFLLRRLAAVNDIEAGIAAIQARAQAYMKGTDCFRKTVKGNLVEFMYLTNSLLATGVLFTLSASLDFPFNHLPVGSRIAIASLWFGLLVYLQYLYSQPRGLQVTRSTSLVAEGSMIEFSAKTNLINMAGMRVGKV